MHTKEAVMEWKALTLVHPSAVLNISFTGGMFIVSLKKTKWMKKHLNWSVMGSLSLINMH